MKPLYNCPYCGCRLKEITHNFAWFQKVCPDQCCIQYSQFYHDSFENNELKYISFSTSDFNVYVYFEKGCYPNWAIIYSRKELYKHGKAGPVLKIPAERIDTKFLENIESSGRYYNVGMRDWMSRLNDKLKLYVLFS